jgi:hypothetical protein
MDQQTVYVRRHWSDYRVAEVHRSSLRDLHWRQSSGGICRRSPRPFLHARMWCDAIFGGELAHSCEHGPAPHDILVCITKVDNHRKTYAELEEAA